MNILSTFAAEASEWFDALMLVAFVLFLIVGVREVMARAINSALLAFGLAVVALAWLLL